jgi:hypothetical protein
LLSLPRHSFLSLDFFILVQPVALLFFSSFLFFFFFISFSPWLQVEEKGRMRCWRFGLLTVMSYGQRRDAAWLGSESMAATAVKAWAGIDGRAARVQHGLVVAAFFSSFSRSLSSFSRSLSSFFSFFFVLFLFLFFFAGRESSERGRRWLDGAKVAVQNRQQLWCDDD